MCTVLERLLAFWNRIICVQSVRPVCRLLRHFWTFLKIPLKLQVDQKIQTWSHGKYHGKARPYTSLSSWYETTFLFLASGISDCFGSSTGKFEPIVQEYRYGMKPMILKTPPLLFCTDDSLVRESLDTVASKLKWSFNALKTQWYFHSIKTL